MTRLTWTAKLAVVLGATGMLASCALLDVALGDRPNSTQMNAIGDIFGSVGAFISVVSDPAAASQSDLGDLHSTEGYRKLLDPKDEGVGASARERAASLDPECITSDDDSATWTNCQAVVEGVTCSATGSGQRNDDDSYSGSSTMTCGDQVTTVAAANLVFDETAGRANGTVTITKNGVTAIIMDLNDLTFCTDEEDVAPNGGSISIDGDGPFAGLPFDRDPLTISFQDDPVCGTALID